MFHDWAHAHEGVLILGSLSVIAFVLTVSIVWSILRPPKKEPMPGSQAATYCSSKLRSIHAVFSWTCMRCVSRSHDG